MQRVMIDTNIIISAILFPKGKASQALNKSLTDRFVPVVCDYVIEELYRKFDEKFPDLLLTGDKDFLESSVTDPHIVSVTEFLKL